MWWRAVIAATAATVVAVSAFAPRGVLAQRQRKVALAPLATLGEEAMSSDVRRVEQQVLSGLSKVPDVWLIPMKRMLAAIKDAKRDDLRNCDGNPACLAELGSLLSADLVVYGEVGGVGELQIAYLKVVDVATRRELRSTTLEVEAQTPIGVAHAAAMRLLAPGRYTGKVVLDVDVDGATIFVDGKLRAKSPAQAMELSVGTHAIRVTHPEYRDFVRFVDVAFDVAQTLPVGLQEYPIVASDIRKTARERPVAPAKDEPTPWYREWYTIAGAGAVVLIGSVVIFAVATGGVDADDERVVR
jgi:hypothetical protein